MSCDAFDPSCPDCRPCLLDPETGKPLPEGHTAAAAVSRAWDAAPREEQEAFWRATVKSSKDPEDLKLVHRLMQRIQAASAN